MKNLTLFLFSFLMLMSCKQQIEQAEDVRILSTAPDVGPSVCTHTTYENYNFSFSTWKDSNDIKYYITNLPFDKTQEEVDDIIARAYGLWNQEIEIPILQTRDSSQADIWISFEYLDGKGGTLGQSEFPPHAEYTPVPIQIIYDKYDIYGSLGGSAVYDFFTIAVHESGHSLGLRHSQNGKSIMGPIYQDKITGLSLDDVLGVRTRYGPAESFEFAGDQYVWINQNSTGNIAANFKESEFFTECDDITDEGHFLCRKPIIALQAIRDQYGVPIEVISTLRSDKCNKQVNGASMSEHLLHNAIDWKFVGKDANWAHKKYVSDIKNQSCILSVMLALGVKGFGSYKTSNHIDARRSVGSKFYGGLNYSTWGLLAPYSLIGEAGEGGESHWLDETNFE